MTKIFSRFIIAFILFTWTAVPAFAQTQFSILPYTRLDAKTCKQMLDQYQVDLKIPDAQKMAQNDFVTAQNEANAVDKEYEAATKPAEDTKKDIKSKYGAFGDVHCRDFPSDAGCGAYNDAQKKFADAEKKKTESDAKLKKAFDDYMGGGQEYEPDQRMNLLGCAINSGRITLAMIPYFITYFSNFLLGMAGLIAVLFVVLGGYRYVIGGLTEDKEKGKQTIMHALMGFGLSLLAWAIVNIVMAAVTG